MKIVSITQPSLWPLITISVDDKQVLVAKQTVFAATKEALAGKILEIIHEAASKLPDEPETAIVLGTEIMADSGQFVCEMAVLVLFKD